MVQPTNPGNSVPEQSQVSANQLGDSTRTRKSDFEQHDQNKDGYKPNSSDEAQRLKTYNENWEKTFSRLAAPTKYTGSLLSTSGPPKQLEFPTKDFWLRVPGNYKSEMDAAKQRGGDVKAIEAIKEKYKDWWYDPERSSKGGNA